MQIVIDIDKEDLKDINDMHFIREDLKFKIGKAIMNGTPLPKGHGRLIDADELKKEYPHDTDCDYPVNTNCCVAESIDNSPTIIEADKESEDKE
jgi:hypothetical protein